MENEKTARGFQIVRHRPYLEKDADMTRLLQESSAVGEYVDSYERPGSTALWVGQHHHLNREEVGKMVEYCLHWLQTGHLFSMEGEHERTQRRCSPQSGS